MLLAIIVDSYAHVKGETEGSHGLSTDLARVMWHGFRRALSFNGTSSFISDQKLLRALQEELKLLGSESEVSKREQAKGIVDVHQQHGHHQVVLLPGAKSVNKADMARLVRFVPFVHSLAPSCCGAAQGKPPSELPHDSAEASELVGGDAVLDLMQRYGSDLAELQEKKDKEILHMIQIENHRRVLALQMGQAKLLDEARQIVDIVKSVYGTAATTSTLAKARQSIFNTVSGKLAVDWAPEGKLEVTVVRASKLPKMDVFRHCDPYWYYPFKFCCLSVCLSVYLSVCLSACLSVYLFIFPSISLYLSLYLSLHLFLYICLFYLYVSIYLSIHKYFCMHTYIHTFTCFYVCLSDIHAYMHTCIHTYIHTCIHACMHACIHTYIHACMHACIHAYMHTCMHAYMYACSLACLHACNIYAYMHTC